MGLKGGGGGGGGGFYPTIKTTTTTRVDIYPFEHIPGGARDRVFC